jgi:hypothetical protein
MTRSSKDIQSEFSRHLRNPGKFVAPKGIEERRLQIYRDLIYKNIERFLATGFPIIRKLYADSLWHDMARDFIERHQSQSPYFATIGAEFIDYLQQERQMRDSDPPYLLELAQYEFAELALFLSDDELPAVNTAVDPHFLEAVPKLSPLAWSMVFEYPVHKIGVDFQPQSPSEQPVCLVVYRNRDDHVRFLEINPLTSRLLTLCEENKNNRTVSDLLSQLEKELPHLNREQIFANGEATFAQLRNLDIIHFL